MFDGQCMAMISRLSKLPPSTTITNSSSDAARKELAALIHQTLREAETDYEQLVDEAQSSSSLGASAPSTSGAVQSLVAKTGEDIKIARRQYRKALLSASHAERDALFAARRNPAAPPAGSRGNEKVSQTELLVSASSDVTAALRRTQQLLQGELSKSRFASETLAESGEALRELTARYSVFDDALRKSKTLIRDLVKKNKSDRWYYETAIRILLATLLWIVVRRLFWGPLWLVVVWPVQTLWWAGAAAVGLGSRSGGSASSAVVGQPVYTSSSSSSSSLPSSSSLSPLPSSSLSSSLSSLPSSSLSLSLLSATTTVATAVFATGTLVPERGDAAHEVAAEAAAAGEAGDRQSMCEVVGKIVDGEPTAILRNTMSRRLEEPPGMTDDEIPRAVHMEEGEPQAAEEVGGGVALHDEL